MTDKRALCWSELPALIADVQAIGDATGLSYIAAQADLGDPEPMADEAGRPYAETSFRWVDPEHAYWRDRKLALHIAFLTAARLTALMSTANFNPAVDLDGRTIRLRT